MQIPKRPRPRLVRLRDSFTADELAAGVVELEEVPATDDAPSEETRGESWGWTKGPPFPRDYEGERPP